MFLHDPFVRRFLKALLIIAGIYTAYMLRDILLLLFIVIILSAGLKPFADKLEAHRIPRAVSVLSVIVVLLVVLGTVVQVLITDVSAQWVDLSSEFANNLESLVQSLPLEISQDASIASQIQSTVTGWISNSTEGIISFGASIFNVFLTVFTVVTLVFYLVLDPNKINRFITALMPLKWKKRTEDFISRSEQKLSSWLIGQLTLMGIMTVVSYFGFRIIDIEFALPLAVLTGLTDVIPVLGSVISFAVVFVITLVTDPFKAVLVAIFFVAIQQIETNFFIPRIMSKSVGIDPVLVILALMTGSALAGILGAVLAVPAAAIVLIAWEEWQKTHPLHQEELEENITKKTSSQSKKTVKNSKK